MQIGMHDLWLQFQLGILFMCLAYVLIQYVLFFYFYDKLQIQHQLHGQFCCRLCILLFPTPEGCAPVGSILKTSTPARIAVFSLFERGKVQCNSFNPDPGSASPNVARSPVKSPRPSPEARLRPKCQD